MGRARGRLPRARPQRQAVAVGAGQPLVFPAVDGEIFDPAHPVELARLGLGRHPPAVAQQRACGIAVRRWRQQAVGAAGAAVEGVVPPSARLCGRPFEGEDGGVGPMALPHQVRAPADRKPQVDRFGHGNRAVEGLAGGRGAVALGRAGRRGCQGQKL